MPVTSANTSMTSWTGSGWVIYSGHDLGIIDTPPPRAADKSVVEVGFPQDFVADMPQVLEPEEYFEFLGDLSVALEAEEEYDIRGIEGSTTYTEYRDRRLGSGPSV